MFKIIFIANSKIKEVTFQAESEEAAEKYFVGYWPGANADVILDIIEA